MKNDLDGIRGSLSESLEQLKQDTVDNLHLNDPPEDPASMREALEALGELKAEVATRYAVDEGGVSSCILGASRPEQVDRNCEMDALPPLPFPFKNQLVHAFQAHEPLFNIE